MLSDATGGRLSFEQRLLASVTKREMIVRLLNNLKGAYLRRGDDTLALAAVDRLLVLDPDDLDEVRDRGLLKFRLGQWGAAIGDLVAYLEGRPEASDRETIEGHLVTLRQRIASLN